jgi:hypothetical protein
VIWKAVTVIVVIGGLFYISNHPEVGSEFGHLVTGLFTAGGNLISSFGH